MNEYMNEQELSPTLPDPSEQPQEQTENIENPKNTENHVSSEPPTPSGSPDLSLFELFRAGSKQADTESPTDRILSHPRPSAWDR